MSAPYVILSRSRLRLTCACEAFPSCERPDLVQTRTILRIRYSRTVRGQEDLQQPLCSCTSPGAFPCGCRRRSDPNRVCDGESSSSSLDHEWQASWLSDGQMELPLKCRCYSRFAGRGHNCSSPWSRKVAWYETFAKVDATRMEFLFRFCQALTFWLRPNSRRKRFLRFESQ